MKKGRFLWSAHRITEKQKAGKARNIKGKQLKNSRSTVSRLHVARLSSASADLSRIANFAVLPWQGCFFVANFLLNWGARLRTSGGCPAFFDSYTSCLKNGELFFTMRAKGVKTCVNAD